MVRDVKQSHKALKETGKKYRTIFENSKDKESFVKDFEVKLEKKDGTTIDCLITATLRKDKEGHAIGYDESSNTCRDDYRVGVMTDQSKMEEGGIDFLIPKPFQFDQILKVIGEAVTSKSCQKCFR